MLQDSHAFSGFSVNDLTKAKEFYGQTLGLDVKENPQGLTLNITGSNGVFVYEKPGHSPATFTILNFPVDDIDTAVQNLRDKGVTFEHYEGMTEQNGIAYGRKHNMGPDIAWFKDPAGNVLAVLKN